MKKNLMSLLVSGLVMVSMGGCSSEGGTTVEEEDNTQVEQPVEEKKEAKEEPVKEKKDILTIENDEDFKHYMTSALTDEEYSKYFDSLFPLDGDPQKVKFEASIDVLSPKDGYDHMVELLVSPGDYSENEVTGPAMKVDSILMSKLNGAGEGDNVTITGTIWGYDEEQCYVDLHIDSIELR